MFNLIIGWESRNTQVFSSSQKIWNVWRTGVVTFVHIATLGPLSTWGPISKLTVDVK